MLSNLLEPELCQFPKGNLLVLIMQLGEREATRQRKRSMMAGRAGPPAMDPERRGCQCGSQAQPLRAPSGGERFY